MNCDICNKWIKHPKNWNRHINSKTHIKKAIQQSEKANVSRVLETIGENVSRCKSDVSRAQETKIYNCRYCEDPFTTRQSRYTHEKKRCIKKKLIDENEELKKLLLEAKGSSGNTTNNNTTNNTTNNINNNTTNNIIIMQNFGAEAVEFTDEFLHQLTNGDISLHQKRIMLENYISSEQESRTLAKTNMRDRLMYAHDGQWNIVPQKLALEQRVKDLPTTYQRSIAHTVKHWPDEEKQYGKATIQEHNGIAHEMRTHKYTQEEDKDLKTIIKCNAYNNQKAIAETS